MQEDKENTNMGQILNDIYQDNDYIEAETPKQSRRRMEGV